MATNDGTGLGLIIGAIGTGLVTGAAKKKAVAEVRGALDIERKAHAATAAIAKHWKREHDEVQANLMEKLGEMTGERNRERDGRVAAEKNARGLQRDLDAAAQRETAAAANLTQEQSLRTAAEQQLVELGREVAQLRQEVALLRRPAEPPAT